MSAPAEVPRQPAGSVFWYGLIRGLVATYLRLFHRFRVRGRRNAPASGGVLIVANHASYLDIPIIAASFPRHVSFVARNTLTNSRFIAWIIDVCGGILIRPGEGDRAALRAITERLDAGCAVAIFPEGTRTSDGSLGEFRGGAHFSAKRSGVPILPAGIRGSFESFSRFHRIPRPRAIQCSLGQPLAADTPDANERIREAILELMADPQSTPRSRGASVTS